MMIEHRAYRDDETPRIGDVVMCFDGAFGTAIIRDIQDGFAYLERPHIAIRRITITYSENFKVEIERLKKEFPVFVTGPSGNVDNRKR